MSLWTDLTDLKVAEEQRQRLEAQLRHSQKLEALGTLAGGVAHDLNNALVPIIALTKATMRQLPEGRERRNLEKVFRASEHARELVRQIVAFSRKEESVKRAFDLGATVREALSLLAASVPKTIRLEEHIEPVPVVFGDPTQLHQVVMNLVANAAQAIGDQPGSIAVRLSSVSPEGMLLTVTDSGRGMDEATLARIFDPFFTTKEVGEGTGLGLSVAHGIIAAHGGRIEATSRPGEGSEFRVFLPAATDQASPLEPPAALAAVASAGENERLWGHVVLAP